MVTQAQSRATTKYVKTHMRQFVLRCHNERDADVISWLEGTGNVNGTLKRLVREEIARIENRVDI